MRIIGGSAAGRLLKVPKGFRVRPTPDLMRQAIFNSLGHQIAGRRVLELFGGTGALSLECLSRGAEAAVCVERSEKHARMIRENLTLSGLPEDHFEVRVQEVFHFLRQTEIIHSRFHLILADPPFGEKNEHRPSHSDSQKLLDDPHLESWLQPEGRFILGHAHRDTLRIPAHWRETKQLRHGDSSFRIFQSTEARAGSSISQR